MEILLSCQSKRQQLRKMKPLQGLKGSGARQPKPWKDLGQLVLPRASVSPLRKAANLQGSSTVGHRTLEERSGCPAVTTTSRAQVCVFLGGVSWKWEQLGDFYSDTGSGGSSPILPHAPQPPELRLPRRKRRGAQCRPPEAGMLRHGSRSAAAGGRGRGSSVPRNGARSRLRQPYGEPCSNLPRR